MSSSLKQAELRRLMKLQREKQATKQPKKPASPKSILRKTTTTRKRPRSPPPLQASNTGGLSSLQGYSSSDDDGSNQKLHDGSKTTASETMSHNLGATKQKTVVASQEQPLPSANAASMKVELHNETPGRATASASDIEESLSAGVRVTSALPGTDRPQQKQVDDATWREFQDLIGDNDTTPVEDETSTKPQQQQKKTTANLETASAAVEESSRDNETDPSTTQVDTSEVEQVAYEARLARLKLKVLAAKKKRKKATSSSEETVSYTPNLASSEESNISHVELLRQRRSKARKLLHDDDDEDC